MSSGGVRPQGGPAAGWRVIAYAPDGAVMIARHRGEHDIRQALWPRRLGRAVTSADERPGAGSGGRLRPSGGARREPPRRSRRGERRRRMWLLGTLAAVGLTGLGFAAGELVDRPSGRPRPPLAARPRSALAATPREWLHDFSTDSLVGQR